MIFDSGRLSISPKRAKSTFGHGTRRARRLPPFSTPTVIALSVTEPVAPANIDFTNACTSSLAMRPPRAVPCTRARSTPSSRANTRTAGEACGTLSGATAAASKATGGVRGPAISGSRPRSISITADAAAGLTEGGPAGALSLEDGASAAAPSAGCIAVTVFEVATAAAFASGFTAPPAVESAASINATTAPSEIVSPTLTLSSRTTPANGAGTSILALSDSSVTSP